MKDAPEQGVVVLCVQVIPDVYDDMKHLSSGGPAAQAGVEGPTATAASSWTPERVAHEVQSALREVLGTSLEPDQPFMSGERRAQLWWAVASCV